MKLPGMTAEVTLYQSNGCYRTNAYFAVAGSTRGIGMIYPGDDGTTGGEIIHVTGTAPVTIPRIPTPGTTQGTVPTGGPRPKPPTNYGQGPNESDLPKAYTCDAETVNLNTCGLCHNIGTPGCSCTCYDCERFTGKCTTSYDCSPPDDFGAVHCAGD
jgi:hypothetical protein